VSLLSGIGVNIYLVSVLTSVLYATLDSQLFLVTHMFLFLHFICFKRQDYDREADQRSFLTATSNHSVLSTSSLKTDITLDTRQVMSTFVNLSMLGSDVRAMLLKIDAVTPPLKESLARDNETNDVQLAFYIASDFVPHQYQSYINYSFPLEWSPLDLRYEIVTSIFISKM